ncbi:beta-ribofuranosylaminobenzene 5'-phosphate synthase family protein [Methylophaga lonarensis]|uniref:beta-ribofuranosylaminobenzene 5'-phosphate synthase family protein n=1 Tax=Methylophaga lonarensis TaxID=999151 RepID=UPI003D28FD49
MNSPVFACQKTTPALVRVRSPARLHLGFLDLNGGLGRKFGSIGMAIDSHYTELQVSRSAQSTISGLTESAPQYPRLLQIQSDFFASLGQHIEAKDQTLSIHIHQLIPEHAGLGSGTQLALSLGHALCQLYGIDATAEAIAQALGRGKRSGIGISSFEHGGFVIDAGIDSRSSSMPLTLMRLPFPSDWTVVLIFDNSQQGVHGSVERSAFSDLPAFPRHAAETICHRTLMQLAPALLSNNLDDFSEAVTEIQRLIGSHFAPIQGGQYASAQVAKLLDYAHSLGFRGVAQSSWGPTGCIFTTNPKSAQALIQQLTEYSATRADEFNHLSFVAAQCDTSGAMTTTKQQNI